MKHNKQVGGCSSAGLLHIDCLDGENGGLGFQKEDLDPKQRVPEKKWSQKEEGGPKRSLEERSWK